MHRTTRPRPSFADVDFFGVRFFVFRAPLSQPHVQEKTYRMKSDRP
jgi:hypothetical protein